MEYADRLLHNVCKFLFVVPKDKLELSLIRNVGSIILSTVHSLSVNVKVFYLILLRVKYNRFTKMYVIMVNNHAWSELMLQDSLMVDPQPQFLSVFTQ